MMEKAKYKSPAIMVRVSHGEREAVKAAAAVEAAAQSFRPIEERDVVSMNTFCRKCLLDAARATLGEKAYAAMLAPGNEQKLAEDAKGSSAGESPMQSPSG